MPNSTLSPSASHRAYSRLRRVVMLTIAALAVGSAFNSHAMIPPMSAPSAPKAVAGCVTNPIVANTADAGTGSLRQAIADACGGGTITFDPAFFDINIPRTITLTSGELTPSVDMTITGPGPGLLTVSGNNASRVLFNASPNTLAISGMTLTGGNGVGATSNGNGGALHNRSQLSLTDMVLTGNSGATTGAALATSFGTLHLLRVTVAGNTGNNVSGLYLQDATGVIADSTFSGNNGGSGEAIRLTSSSVNTSLTLTNVTISGNTTTSANSAIRVEVLGTVSSTLIANNSTITGNSTSSAGNGAIWARGAGTGARVITLRNTIVSGNTVNGVVNDIEGAVDAASSFNLIGTGGGLVNGVNGNLVGINNPLLAPLGNYGGSTQTRTPLPGSAAINAGSNALASANDQRGIARPQQGTVDIGAAESRGFVLAAASGTPQSAVINTAFAAPLIAGVTANQAIEPVNGGRVIFTAPGSGASASLVTNPATITAGQASATATANATIGGPYTITTASNGASGTASFALTNLTDCITNPVVANAADAGAGSLRQAIADACVGSTITFDPVFFGVPRTITLSSGELVVARNMTITGPGAALLTVSGNNASRVLSSSNTTLTVSAMTFAGGNSIGSVASGFGGAVLQSGGALTVNDMVITGSTCVFTSSVAVGNGTLNLLRTSISGNTCNNVSGIYLQDSNAVLLDSTLSNNTGSSGDAIRTDASNGNNTLTLNNVTISGNTTSTDNSAVRLQPQAGRSISFTATNSTISGNSTSGPGKGAIWVNGVGTHTIVLHSTIVSGNTVNGVANDFEGTVDAAQSEFNLVGSGSGLVNGVNNNQVGIDNPLLAPLGNYGGSTLTRTPLPGSPAINAGSNALAPANDQRGVARPQQGTVDIGAVESRGFVLSAVSGTPQTGPLNVLFAAPLVTGVVANQAIEPVDGGQVRYTEPAAGASAALATSPATISGGQASVSATANGIVGNYVVAAAANGSTGAPNFSLTNGIHADLAITKTNGSTSTPPGAPVVYTLVASNAGPNAATGAVVTDNFPATLNACTWTCVGAGGGTCTASGIGNIADGVDLPVAATATYTASCTVAPSASGTLSNTATIAEQAGTTDPNTGNNSATDTDTLSGAAADLSINLIATPDPVHAGANLTYLVTALNGGLADAQDVVITVNPPAGTTLVSATTSGGGICTTAAPIACTWAGATAPATPRSATIIVNVPFSQTAALIASASASSATTDPVTTDNATTASTGVIVLVPVPMLDARALAMLVLLLGMLGVVVVRRQP